jgi:GNAT superfamily N-acetyltransferase
MAAAALGPLAQRFRLVELQQEALKVQTKIDDFHQWGAPALDQDGYQKKEALQRATPHSQRGSVFWALVARTPAHALGILGSDEDVRDDDVVAGETEIVCHCESHPFDVAFRNARGEIVRGISHNIGSVFTLPAYRGQGLARFFLTALQARMATKPNVIGSALYSDIGPKFYDALGWRLYASTDAKLEVAAPRNAQVASEEGADPITMLLLDETLDQMLARDNTRLVEEMATLDKYKDKEVFASLLTRESVEWQFCLGVFYAGVRGFSNVPTHTGVYIDDDAFLVWCHNLKESTLYVQHARIPGDRPSATVRLLRAAIREARDFKLANVKIWDPAAALFNPAVTAALDVVKEERDDSLSSLIVFDQYRTPTARDTLPLWLNNEKLAWV